jgi:uridine kinase
MRIYQRSVSFVLIVAVHDLFPQVRVIVDHSVTMGGFFCQIVNHAPFTAQELQAVEQRMRAIIAANEPIIKERMATRDAIDLFATQGYDDKVRLLQSYAGEEVTVYSLCGMRDYFYGHMMPSTGHLGIFRLDPYAAGFVMRLPQRQAPMHLPEPKDHPKLMSVYQSYSEWIDILGVADIGALNAVVEKGTIRDAILVSEALHEKRISNIADEIVARRGRVRLVFIAGPSSSGKTTFARRLSIQLLVNGLRPYALGMDDYFVDRERTPRDQNGEYDFEALEAVDLPLFQAHVTALLRGERVRVPRYNFKTGKSEAGDEVQLADDTVIIVEGIHGLNPKLVADLPPECYYRIYISALTQLNLDHHNRVPTTDSRLLRRIVRDARTRGYAAQNTIARWESVRRGEERNIFAFQENADVMFNSALVYELAVLKPLAEPLLLRVPEKTMEAIEARRLLAFLRWVRPCEPDLIPSNSLLREFVGDSVLHDFQF